VVVGVVVVVVGVVVVVVGVVVVVAVVVVGVVVVVVVVVVLERTTALWRDVAIVDPFLFVAITAARSVEPTSAAMIRYVEAVAVVIGEHSAPMLLQRFHWYA
jgi:hypothetical protein